MILEKHLINQVEKAVRVYAQKTLRLVSLPKIRLLEIIIVPSSNSFIIVRFNVSGVKSVCDPKLNRLAQVTSPLIKHGIFCIFRPVNFSTTNTDINKIVSRLPYQRIRSKVKLPKKISNLIKKCGQKSRDNKIWEVEFSQKKKVVIRLFGKRYKTVKRHGIIYEFIPEWQKEIAKKLVQTMFYCASKKINLLTYLFCRK